MNHTPQAPAPPPAALLVINGKVTERTIQLEHAIAEKESAIARANARRAAAEGLIATRQAEATAAKPAPAKRTTAQKHNWLAPVINLND